MPKMKAADQWVNEEDTYNQAKKELKATKKARDQRHKSVHSPTDTKGNVDVNESLDDKRRANVEKQKANVASTTQKSQASQSAVRGVFAKAAAAKAKSKAKQKERNDISKEIQSTIKNQSEELQMTVDEAVRLPSEFGHIVMVGVQWRGKMYNIRMFFPQAKMPSRGDVQDEIIKVYPGGKVVYFQRDELPSNEAQFDNDRNPLIKVTKESAEVEEACKPKYDNTKSPDSEKKKKALAKKHGGEENIKGHPQYENRFASHTAGMSDAQKDMASSQVSKGFAYRHGRRLDKANFGDRKKAGKRGNPAQYRKSADSPENELRYPYGKSNIRQGKGSIKDLNKVKKEELLKSLRGFMDEGKIADAMRANLEKLRASDEKSQKNLEKFLKGTKQVRDDEKKAQDNA